MVAIQGRSGTRRSRAEAERSSQIRQHEQREHRNEATLEHLQMQDQLSLPAQIKNHSYCGFCRGDL